MSAQEQLPYEPPLFPDRILSTLTIGAIGSLARGFLLALNTTETHGLPAFLDLLRSRRDEKTRTRGLITVSNHLSVLDDPIIWGVLPLAYHWAGPGNARWALGSYDICFKNGQSSLLSSFFTYGNTLPTHRLAHSPVGGLFQPTITQCIRLLSDPHVQTPPSNDPSSSTDDNDHHHHHHHQSSFPSSDPFTSASLTYTTTGHDAFPAPAAYPSRRHSWVHIFPEGMIHQHRDRAMRYFKWGVARLILEAEPCPDVVPVWIDGLQDVMSDARGWPRAVPRARARISVVFGEVVDGERAFGGLRERWRELKERRGRREERLGVIEDEELRSGPEAERLRIDVALAVREEVLKLRRRMGYPDEDPKRSWAETWSRQGEVVTEEERGLVREG